jgi:hypothetical protein
MRFKDWLIKEVGTSTGDVAAFRRISIPMVRRKWAPEIATMFADNPPKEKKKVVKQPQVEETAHLREDPKYYKKLKKIEKD